MRKIKLDENLGRRLEGLFRNAGYDVKTVYEQKMQGCDDVFLFDACSKENRCLVTLDLDFSNTLRFPLEESAGIIVFRLPGRISLSLLEDICIRLIAHLEKFPLENELWIVEPGRIRIHKKEE
jgi:predicted nuclease of predicted toxin-antitoxin system